MELGIGVEALFTGALGLQSGAPANVLFVERLPSAQRYATGASARAFLFVAVEDLAITPVETLPRGTPVVALRRGGTAETVEGLAYSQPPQAIVAAIEDLELRAARIRPVECVLRAARYRAAAFDRRFGERVDPEWSHCSGDASPGRGTARATTCRAGAA